MAGFFAAFGTSSLDLIESPWAYSVMAVTILIDANLLYIFFTVQKKTPQTDLAHCGFR
jgi:hypothetical protein